MATRRWMLGTVVALAVGALAGCSKGKGKGGPALPLSGGVSLNASVAFRVHALTETDVSPQLVGETPATNPLVVPVCVSWWVEPLPPVDMAKVREELQARGIPGLALSGASDDDLAHLEGLTGLQTLDLDGTRITDAGLEHLEDMTRLQRLGLHGVQVTDAGLAHLQGLTRLNWLVLESCGQVTDLGLAHLKGLTALEYIDLRRTKVTNAGVAELRKALPDARILR